MKRSLSKESRVNVGKLYPVADTGEILSPQGEEMESSAEGTPRRDKPKYVGGHSPARSSGGQSSRRC